jgi:hypothetical protein
MTPDAVPDRPESPMSDVQPQPARPSRFRPAASTLALAAAVVVAAGLTRLIPDEYRPYNFTAVGALALFAAARIGFAPGLVLALGSLLASDFALWYRHGYDRDYLPSWPVYAAFALYAVLGWALLRRTESPVRIAGVTVAGGLLFFLITNFASWVTQSLPYGYSLAGLVNCYAKGLEFYRGTLSGDLAFGGLLFGLHAVLSRAYFPAERVVPQPALQPEVVR